MFDLSIWEIAVIGVVAVLVVGPKELPRALMTAGKWIRKFRSLTGSLRSGLDNMIRETEMKELEEKWAKQNQQIMADHPNEMLPLAQPSEGNMAQERDISAEPNISAEPDTMADPDAATKNSK